MAEMRLSANSQQIKNGRTQFAPTVRRRLHRIVRNSLWLSLTHCATPPFPQKSRSARLFGCKRPLDGSLSLPTFADLYIAFSRELSFISDNLTAAASHRPTTSSFAPYQNTDRGKPCPYGTILNLIFFFVLAVFFSLFDNVCVNIICKLAVDFELLSEYDK